MKAFICALALAFVPTVAGAADMHSFDYTGTGNPVALVAASETHSAPAPVAAEPLPSAMFLTRDSDFSKFVKAGVPLETHRQAMRLLWATNPELGRPLAGDSLALGYVSVPTQTASASGWSVAAIAD